MIIASLLLILAFWLNKDDNKMLLLTLLVGGSYFMPMDLITDRTYWYSTVIFVELVVGLSAVILRLKASAIVAVICLMLTLNHITGWVFGVHKPHSPYYIVVNFLEYLEVVVLSLFSNKVINTIKGPLCSILKPLRGS